MQIPGALVDEIVNAVKGHPGLGVWKGIDEPALGRAPVAGCVAHPVSIATSSIAARCERCMMITVCVRASIP